MKQTKRSSEPPAIPLGLDSYRMWERWPQLRIGVRAYMRSTHDRTGGNESACASHYYYQERNDFNVALHTVGKGCLYFVRTNCWHGSPWHYEIDGKDTVVSETATEDPVMWMKEHRKAPNPPATRFEPHEVLPAPLTQTWSTTKGADLNWVPIPFEDSLRLAYGRTRYGTGYYIYHKFVPDAPLTSPLRAFDWRTPPDRKVLRLLERAGTDIAPRNGARLARLRGTLSLGVSESATVCTISKAPSMLRALEFTIPRADAEAFSAVRLRITWDNRTHPSVDAPFAMFFGAGMLYNDDDREYLVRGLPMSIRYMGESIRCSCYFPMPFFRSARVELVNTTGHAFGPVTWSVRYGTYDGPRNHVAYFHATHRDFPAPEAGRDLVLLDTRGVEGSQDWCGHFTGTSFIFTRRSHLRTLEGIPRFFFDDAESPQGHGTGTEEWGGGGDYWGGRNMTLPLAGHPTGSPRGEGQPKHALDMLHSAYRFLLADLMPFGKNARIQLEHGGHNETTEHYESVTYWYGLPGSFLTLTDSLDVGSAASERKHAYRSPQASTPAKVVSRFEIGVDHINHDPAEEEVFPAHTETERHTAGTSEFTLRLNSKNFGVMLRRRFDYLYPNQRADVYVAGTRKGAAFEHAGVWFSPGSNTCIYSDPKDEDGAAQQDLRTCNRRFKESEFLIARGLTRGRTSIRVRIVCRPDDRPLAPGLPFPEKSVWSEIHYSAYCFVMPAGADHCLRHTRRHSVGVMPVSVRNRR